MNGRPTSTFRASCAGRLRRLLTTCLCSALATALAADAEPMMPKTEEGPDAVHVSSANYRVPDIRLVRDDGRSVELRDELDDGRPVLLNFIFTSCASICPLSSKVFADFAHELGADRAHVHLVSISIDPEQDTPARLREYAKTFDAGPEWQHYTGTRAASEAAQRAFDAYRGSKMEHTPLTLLRRAPGEPWVRVDGYVTPGELMHYYQTMLAQR